MGKRDGRVVNPMDEMRALAGISFLDDGVLAGVDLSPKAEQPAVEESIDEDGAAHLAKLLASMDARAGAIRADLNDLAREALSVSEDAKTVGAEDEFWREFRPAAKKLVAAFAHVTQILQQARESVGWEADDELPGVTEGPRDVAAEEDEGAEQTEGKDVPSAKQDQIAVGVKGWLKGVVKAAGTWEKQTEGTYAKKYVSDVRRAAEQGMASMPLKGVKGPREVEHAKVESAPLAIDGDPIAEMALAQMRGLPVKEGRIAAAPKAPAAAPEARESRPRRTVNDLDAFLDELDGRDEVYENLSKDLDI